ncbi:hypothetical protein FOA52_008480 [Chlamydomonas sp. UWO 241]|nr:hypothetical protein FOA52_008480 [Chlamydomonas sp. UWO 241]
MGADGGEGAGVKGVASLEGHTDRVWAVRWSPDGAQLASCSGDKSVRIWARSNEFVGGAGAGCGEPEWRCAAVLEDGHTRTVRACSWSPSGRYLATASFDGTTAIWEHDGGSWEQVATLEGHENEVKCVAWSPGGSLIATCGRDKSVWVWESIPGNEYECVDVKHGHSQDVKSIAWHPTGDVLASCSYDDTIRLWTADGDEWACGQVLGGPSSSTPGGHTSSVWSVAFEPTGEHMVSCSDDCSIKVWRCGRSDASTSGRGLPWSLETTLSGHHSRAVYTVDWGRGGLIAAGDGDNRIRVYGRTPADATTVVGPSLWCLVAEAEAAHTADVNCVAWHPLDGTLLASAGDDGLVKLWRVEGAAVGVDSMQMG